MNERNFTLILDDFDTPYEIAGAGSREMEAVMRVIF